MTETPIPIAVVGLSCRFPGAAKSPSALWDMLISGQNAWSDVPADRFNWKSFYHPDGSSQGSHNHRGGHFLTQDIAAFDAAFFGIPASERPAIDPQQRIQLEVAYEALEDAGIPLDDIQGTDTAVYVAVFGQDYALMQYKDLEDMERYHMTGTGSAIAANRISYLFNLKGPSVTLDTGCSGSLVAVHQACQSLRLRECGIAMAGGTNLILGPDMMVPMSMLNILNGDGKCFSFDQRGSGYGRGEGAAMIVLKRLDDALRDGDHIRAVIRNTGVGQDGKTSGILMPSRSAQESLIRSVYQKAGLDPRDTTYIEAHGTGTATGDQEEIAAIQSVFGAKEAEAPLHIGSIKPNIGHLESASGIAGLIKGILMLERGVIPPTVNLEGLKSNLSLDDTRLKIPTQVESPTWGAVRRISVNSFGYGGTNSHAILDSGTDHSRSSTFKNGSTVRHNGGLQHSSSNGLHKNPNGMNGVNRSQIVRPQVIAISSKSEKSLLYFAENLRHWINEHLHDDGLEFTEFAYTLSSRRSRMEWRHAFLAGSFSDALQALDPKALKPSKSLERSRKIFIFTGQGAQWYGMGRELLQSSSNFQRSIRSSDQMLQDLGASWSLEAELSEPENDSQINLSQIAQPATTAIQVALVELLRTMGVSPDVVLGHSSGEIAAAYAAGAITHKSAIQIAYYRGLLTTREWGAMLAVGLGEQDVLNYMGRLPKGYVTVACSNSPSSCTVSGDEDAIMTLKSMLDADSIFSRRLKVDRAYHSRHLDEPAKEYLRNLAGIEEMTPNKLVTFVSSVDGKAKTSEFGATYWVQNLLSKVRFREGLEHIEHLRSHGGRHSPKDIFIEIGPHDALSGPSHQTITKSSSSQAFNYHATLKRDQNALDTILQLSARLFEHGVKVDLHAVNLIGAPGKRPRVLHDLPSYAWDHSTRYWHESRLSKEHRFRAHPYHSLVGIRVPGSSALRPIWRHILSVDRLPWLLDHASDGFKIFPASGYICMAIEATRQLQTENGNAANVSRYRLRDVVFSQAIVIPESPESLEIQLHIVPSGRYHDRSASQWSDFQVISISAEGSTVEHCRGSIAVEFQTVDEVEGNREYTIKERAAEEHFTKVRSMVSRKLDHATLYNGLKTRGNYYGPTFSCMTDVALGEDSTMGTLKVPDTRTWVTGNYIEPHVIFPGALDALLHAPIFRYEELSDGYSIVVAGIRELEISAEIHTLSNTELETTAVIPTRTPVGFTTDISVFQSDQNETLKQVIHVVGAELRATGSSDNSARKEEARDMCYRMAWDVDADFISESSFKKSDGFSDEEERRQEKKVNLLNQAAALYIRDCIASMPDSSCINGSAHLSSLFDWMKRFRHSVEYQNLTSGLSETDCQALLSDAGELGVEGEVLCRIGENLNAILTSSVNPLELMTESDLLYRLYADDASSRCYAHMIHYLRRLVFKSPVMKVLELGAGTGGATEPLLRALSSDGNFPFLSYDFTDVSTGFFERSRNRLQEWDGYIQYKRLDIENDPVEQGFEAGIYDLIIASNVLHVVPKISSGLHRIRKLLKPDGRLVMIETNKNVPFYNTCLGTLPGWWAGVDDNRTDGPFLSVEQWHSVLRDNGFGGVDVSATDFDGSAQRCAMMVSKAMPDGKPQVEDSKIPVKILLSPHWSNRVLDFAEKLQSLLQEAGSRTTIEELACETIDNTALNIVLDDASCPVLKSDAAGAFEAAKELMIQSTKVLWVTAQHASSTGEAERGLITGFARVARMENQSLNLATLDIQTDNELEGDHIASKVRDLIISRFSSPVSTRSREFEYVYKNGELLIPRLIPDQQVNQHMQNGDAPPAPSLQPFHQEGRGLRLYIEKPGVLDSMIFVDDTSLSAPLSDSEVEVKVEACGINYKDVLIALGQVKKPLPMAGEFSGRITRVGKEHEHTFKVGDVVCGFGAAPYASLVRVNGHAMCHVPDSIPMSLAASIPVVYCTAYHALVEVARLVPGQTVLIHSATGGVGQAAVKIAQRIGATIFATVGSASKQRFLIDEFGIPEEHIFSSRLKTFGKGILRITNGKGVDVVLNSLSGEMLQESWNAIAPFGTFVELGKADAFSKNLLDMGAFERNVTFASVDLQMIHQYRPQQFGTLLKTVLKLFEEGELSNESVTAMSIGDIAEAFRLMQGRKHIGKLILEAKSDDQVLARPRPSSTEKLHDGATYLIAGGLGGVGLEIARFLVSRGAKHIAILSRRRKFDSAERQKLLDEFQNMDCTLKVYTCDIRDSANVKEVFATCASGMPPIKGIIQAAMVLNDQSISQITREDFQTVARPKIDGTKNLLDALNGQTFDFFILLSSASAIIGSLTQASYAAANTFLDTLANENMSYGRHSGHLVSLNLPPITDVGVLANNRHLQQTLKRQGFLLMKPSEVLSLVGYVISGKATASETAQIVAGFDYRSFTDSDNKYSLENPLFSQLLRSGTSQTIKDNKTATLSIEETLASAESRETAEVLIADFVAQKIATLAAFETENVDLNRRVADFGIDSLVIIELKNWISQNFQAKVQPSEISDSKSIVSLSNLIATRSTVIKRNPQLAKEEHTSNGNGFTESEQNGSASHEKSWVLPKQPLPDLDASLDHYLSAVQPIFTEDEYAKALQYVTEFRKPGSFGRELHARLERLANDPKVDNWQADIYAKGVHLRNRVPLVPWWNFFGTHLESPIAHSSAERAAVISWSAYQFKQKLDAGKIEHEIVNGEAKEVEYYKWLFNTCREPHHFEDKMMRYPGNDYIIAFRRGHMFKIPLRNDNGPLTCEQLRSWFQVILNMDLLEEANSWVGILTMDNRDSWAEVRQLLRSVDPANDSWLRTLEAATFNIYLDAAEPKNASERGRQFLHGYGLNRWSDKSLGFVVCDNGTSAFIGEHTMIDGYVIRRLNDFVTEAIHSHRPSKLVKETTNPEITDMHVFHTTPLINEHIERVRVQLNNEISGIDLEAFTISGIGTDFFRSIKCAPISGVQVAIQLACRRYFGYNVASFETVSLSHFLKGRVDINHVLWPPVARFCEAASEPHTSPKKLKELFLDAARTHANNLMRASRGQGFDRYFLSLEWSVQEGEEVPILFSNPLYEKKSRPQKLMTDCLFSGCAEVGSVLPDPESLWIHFEPASGSVRFSIWGRRGQIERFRTYLEESVERVREILETA